MGDQEHQIAAAKSEQDLRTLVAEYEAKIDAITELVARIRHEINNPLTGVLGQAQLLLREELTEKARKRVQTIEELAVRMRDIVAQLRQVQRSVKGTEDEEAAEREARGGK